MRLQQTYENFYFPFGPFSVCEIPKTWKHGDMKMETWKHGNREMRHGEM
jgi:hypothetical protein